MDESDDQRSVWNRNKHAFRVDGTSRSAIHDGIQNGLGKAIPVISPNGIVGPAFLIYIAWQYPATVNVDFG